MIIAIDGAAGTGKGTLAKRLADHLGMAHLDTGALYRAVGLTVLQAGGDPSDAAAATEIAHNLDVSVMKSPELRSETTGAAASHVAAIPAVRDALFDFQRRFATQPPDGTAGAVLDGRDVGTVICPDADAKFYLDANLDERVGRRVKELRERGLPVISSAVRQEMQDRDARDASRAIAPLKPADDAFILDTTGLDADAVFERALDQLRELGLLSG
jgi:cytidylate kinase